MAPKKKRAIDDESEEEFDDLSVQDLSPTKKKVKNSKSPKPVKNDDEEGSVNPKKTKLPRAKAPRPPTEPTSLENGWTAFPPSLLYKENVEAQGGAKIAAFDFDGTLVTVKSGANFATSSDDWRFFNDQVATKLKQFHEEGYKILIISNQGGIKKAITGKASENARRRLDNTLSAINKDIGFSLPVQAIFATLDDEFRKPLPGMWEFFLKNLNKGVTPDLGSCVFVGDAAGRAADINDGSDSDKMFAKNVGIRFSLPEDVFGGQVAKKEGDDNLVNVLQEYGMLLKKTATGEHAKRIFGANTIFKAIKAIRDFTDGGSELTSGSQLQGIAGIGKGTRDKVDEILKTGTLKAWEDLKGEVEGGGGGNDGATAAPMGEDAHMALKFL